MHSRIHVHVYAYCMYVYIYTYVIYTYTITYIPSSKHREFVQVAVTTSGRRLRCGNSDHKAKATCQLPPEGMEDLHGDTLW